MMRRFSTAFLRAALVWLSASAPTALWARDLTPAETTNLAETVSRFNAAMTARDMEAVADTIPPRMMQFIAKGAGIDVQALRGVMIEQMKAALEDVEIVSFSMDMGKAEHEALADGTPYVLIPTETVVAVEPLGKTAARSHTLALLDENRWYLVRISEAQQAGILKQVYPGFATVRFPEGTMETVVEPVSP